jgi:hypothetical protein
MSSPIRSMALVLTFSLLSAPSLRAQGKGKPAPEEQTGLEVGAKAPKFTLKDQEGKERSLDEFLRKGKVALVFYPLGRLVTLLPRAAGPAATRPQVHRRRRGPGRRHQL